MTPELIAAVLALPLPVRLELLEADPTGAGWWIRTKLYGLPPSVKLSDTPPPKSATDDRDYWLPCNPLAVIEVAARILAQRHGLPPSIELLGPDGDGGWTCRLVIARGVTVEAEGSRAEIGVRVLVGVVNADSK